MAPALPSVTPNNAELEVFLAEFVRAGDEVLYVPNLGNAGDSLIAAATFQVFRRIGLRYHLLDHHDIDPGKTEGAIVLYGGGGNLVKHYKSARNFIAAHHRRARRFVLLPHTINGHEELLAELGPNVDLIARERRSLEYVRAHASRARHHLMHDIALGVDLDELRCGPLRLFAPLPPPRAAVRLGWFGMRRLRSPAPAPGPVLDAFRTDSESANTSWPARNFDLSNIYMGWVAPEPCARWASRAFLAIIDGYDVVRTDRLHVGIAGALLGKRVLLHDNCYGKNRAVWEHSITGRFENVEWRGTKDGLVESVRAARADRRRLQSKVAATGTARPVFRATSRS